MPIAPLSEEAPTESEVRLNDSFLAEVMHLLDGPSLESDARFQAAAQRVGALYRDWLAGEASRAGGPDAARQVDAARSCDCLKIFGSFRLGTHTHLSDLDVLIVAPKWLTRERFFAGFGEVLRATRTASSLVCAADAYVPVIKLVLDGVPVDIIFASIDQDAIGPRLDLLQSLRVLRNVRDERTLRALNGPRVTETLLQLAPNVDNFRLVLRAVKLWARRRCVYGNTYGFPGGVSWAILVVWIMLLYPKALPLQLLAKFFYRLHNWNWATPITLRSSEGHLAAALRLREWTALGPADRRPAMAIVTPAYPAMNSTHNVTNATLNVIRAELTRGAGLMLERETLRRGAAMSWLDVFEPLSFFTQYRHYVQLELSAPAANAPDENNAPMLDVWAAYVESRLRVLASLVARDEHVRFAHVYPDSVRAQPPPRGNVFFFVGLAFHQPASLERAPPAPEAVVVDLRGPIATFVRSLLDWDGLDPAMDCCITRVRAQDLPEFVAALDPAPTAAAQPRKRPRSPSADLLGDAAGGDRKRTLPNGGAARAEPLDA